MPRKYSDALHQTVIDAVTVMGLTQQEAASTYKVGLSTVPRWVESSEHRTKTLASTFAGNMSVERLGKQLHEKNAFFKKSRLLHQDAVVTSKFAFANAHREEVVPGLSNVKKCQLGLITKTKRWFKTITLAGHQAATCPDLTERKSHPPVPTTKQTGTKVGNASETICTRNYRRPTLGYQIPKHPVGQFFTKTRLAAPAA